MIKLIRAHVFKYKSIEDSSPVQIDENVTVLVGKNESGKSAFLEALHKALPLTSAKFDYVFDYPRKDYVRYRSQHEAKSYANAVELTFRIEKNLAQRINNEVFEGSEVVPPGHLFMRTTTYGNTSTLSLELNQEGALAASRKRLRGIECVEEVFADAKRLDEVVERIEKKELPADGTLAAFAKEWRDRFANHSANWDMVGWHIWNAYLSPSLPRFFYFDDYKLLEGKINLEALNQRRANKQLTGADETALGLFELAGTDLRELMSEQGYENSKAKLEAIGLTITEQVFEYWKQNTGICVEFDIKADPTDLPPYNNGKNLYIRVKNLRHGVTVPFDQRSKGFIWFFSFMVWFSAVKSRLGTDKEIILLLDEPGLSLHALAQADFVNYIGTLSKSHQIIYTTHSPFMVESDGLHRVRVVEDRPKEGAKVSGDLVGSREDSLFPLQAALGYSIAQNLFIAKKNILLEGPSDLILLQHMSALLEKVGKRGLLEGVLVPVGGLDKVATFVALLGANKLTLVVLHDRGRAPHQGIENLIRQKLIERKRIFDYSMFRAQKGQESDLEDLFPENIYIQAFNASYASELGGAAIDPAGLGQHPRIVERINLWLEARQIRLLRDGGFNHYRVAQALLPMLSERSLSVPDVDRFDELFGSLNAALSG
ncbi:MAG TPA: AAA family ATPase [Terriglobia bacterium]|nr:AAA family ATPase [Terriglobia bacterium]